MTDGNDLKPQDHYEIAGAAAGALIGGWLGPHGAHAGIKLGILAARWARDHW